MQAHELVAEAKQLIAKAEGDIKDIEHVEATQLRIAVNRLHLFAEQVAKLKVTAPGRYFSKDAKPEGIIVVPGAKAKSAESDSKPAPKRRGSAKAKSAESE